MLFWRLQLFCFDQEGKMRSILLLALVICTLMVVNGGVVKRSDDVTFQDLVTLVEQQAAAISTLQATVNSQQAAINGQHTAFSTLQATVNSQQAAFNTLQATVNSQHTALNSQQATINSQQATIHSLQGDVTGLKNNVQTLSKSVAFTARFSSDTPTTNGHPLVRHQTLVFDNVVTNAGNGYNPTTGIFTSPLAGYYAFSIVGMEPDGASHPGALALSIVRNGAIVDEMWVLNNLSVNNEQASTHTVIHLAAGDKVWIRQEGTGDGVRGGFLTVFTGFLVHAD